MRWLLLTAMAMASCGRTSVPPPPPATPITPFAVAVDDVVRLCAMEVSCLASPPITTGCIDAFEYGIASGKGYFVSAAELRRFVHCAATSPDCPTALACASRGHGPDYCAAHPGGSCDGAIAVSCAGADWTISTTDCGALGMTCRLDGGGSACSDGRVCGADQSWRCDGNRFVGCGTSYDCATYAPGYSCRPQPQNALAATLCYPSGPRCASSVCNGSLFDQCWSGEVVRVDCAVFASHCATDASGPRCLPDASDCGGDEPNRCDGNLLQQCVNGRWRDFECATIGLVGCQPTRDGARCA
jgi:hypothetical protein